MSSLFQVDINWTQIFISCAFSILNDAYGFTVMCFSGFFSIPCTRSWIELLTGTRVLSSNFKDPKSPPRVTLNK